MELSQTKLTIPVLAIGGDRANGALRGPQIKIVALDVGMVVLKRTGHWVLEERPKQTPEALLSTLSCRKLEHLFDLNLGARGMRREGAGSR